VNTDLEGVNPSHIWHWKAGRLQHYAELVIALVTLSLK